MRTRQTSAADSYGNAGHAMRARERKLQEDQFEARLEMAGAEIARDAEAEEGGRDEGGRADKWEG